MPMQRDYYEVLSVAKDAGPDEIKKAYRKLAMKYHPDKNPGDKGAEESFKEVAEAYDVLHDQQKRQRYDRFGHQGVKGGSDGFSGFGVDLGDALRTFMSEGFGDLFGAGRGARGSRVRRGKDLQVRLRLTLEDVAAGVEKKIKLKKAVVCDSCDGSGGASGDARMTCLQCHGAGEVRQVSQSLFGQFVNIATCPRCHGDGQILKEPCKKCGGDGRTRGESVVAVDIPAGVTSGNYITVRGEGDVGPNGGPSGDVIILIEELEHESFERHGDDVLYSLPLSFAQVSLGAEVEVPTLGGRVKLQVPAGTQANKILRMKHKGIPHLSDSGRGDQLVRVVVWTPTRLDAREKKLLNELAQSENFKPPSDGKGFLGRFKDAIM